MAAPASREIVFLGSSKDDVTEFPLPVKRVMGYALRLAQQGGRHPGSKLLAGFSGARVIEIRDDYEGDTYRTMYTVTLGDVVYVLHAFQKKSTKGIETPRHHIETIEQRLRQAKELHAQRERERKEGKR